MGGPAPGGGRIIRPVLRYAPLAALGYLLAVLLVVLALPAQAFLLVLTLPFDRNRIVPGRFLRFLAVALTSLFPPWRLRVVGRFPGRGPYVVVANHQSMLDVPLLSRLPREMKWMAKESLFRVPWVGWMFALAGDIPVRRGDKESGQRAIRRAKKYLESGVSVMVFPEGTRTSTGELGPFRSGAFRLAVEAGVPVLPVAVSGTAAGMPRGNPWVRPCRGTARVLEPVLLLGGEREVAHLREVVWARIAAALSG